MTTDTMPSKPAAGTLLDPVLREKVRVHEATGHHYVPQSLRGYLLGRALDVLVVAAAAFALAKGAVLLLAPAAVMAQEWAPVAVFGLILFAVIFLYGGIAGTVGTIGETITRMRVVTIDDGSAPGFRTGGLQAVGWFLYVIFTLMLNGDGNVGTRYVAVSTKAAVFRGEPPVAAEPAPAPHTDQA